MICDDSIHKDIQSKSFQRGYDAAIKDVVYWLNKLDADYYTVGLAIDIERDEAKGAANE